MRSFPVEQHYVAVTTYILQYPLFGFGSEAEQHADLQDYMRRQGFDVMRSIVTRVGDEPDDMLLFEQYASTEEAQWVSQQSGDA